MRVLAKLKNKTAVQLGSEHDEKEDDDGKCQERSSIRIVNFSISSGGVLETDEPLQFSTLALEHNLPVVFGDVLEETVRFERFSHDVGLRGVLPLGSHLDEVLRVVRDSDFDVGHVGSVRNGGFSGVIIHPI